MLIILGIAAVLLLALLYRYIPRKKIFYYFLLTIIAASAAIYNNWTKAPEPAITPEKLAEVQQEQQIFSVWYEEYQRDIIELDRNWQWYHQIIEAFKEDNISVQTAYIRLQQLDQDTIVLRNRIASHAIPSSLDDTCYDNIASLMEKTNAYVEAQYKTIALSRAVCDPANLKTNDQAEQSRLVQTVMLRESPVGLYTAREIIAIREHLKLPDDDNNFAK